MEVMYQPHAYAAFSPVTLLRYALKRGHLIFHKRAELSANIYMGPAPQSA